MKNSIKAVVVTLAFNLAGCGDGEPDLYTDSTGGEAPSEEPMQEVRISEDFSDVLRGQIEGAVQLWCEAGVRCFDVLVVDPSAANVIMGGDNVPCSVIAIQPDPEHVFATIAQAVHGLGHAINCGAPHIEEPGHRMSDPAGEDPNEYQLTGADIDWALASER